MISKYVVVSFLAAVAAASVISSEKQSTDLVYKYEDSSDLRLNTRYHIIAGNRVDGDVLQFEERIQVQAGISVKFIIDQNLRINSIMVVDLNETKNGDYPFIVEGGIGAKYVTIMFLSDSEKKVDFLVSIHAH